MAARRRIALATRELYPFAPGGIAPVIAGLARDLSAVAAVDVFTTSGHREAYERLARAGNPYCERVRVHFADEPDPADPGDYFTYMHAWSARLYAALAAHYDGAGPDLIEFCDYLAEGFVCIQARHTREPWLAHTQVAVRTHTTAELSSVLNGSVRTDFETETVFEAERYCLEQADLLLHPGGDILDTYRRFYGAGRLAPAARVPDAFLTEFDALDQEEPAREGPLKVLYIGRLERRKGVQNLIRAAVRIAAADWQLSLLGSDTPTAPLFVSVRDQLELMTAGDERIAFLEPVERRQVGDLIRAHDVVIVPSLWECWPNVVREAFLFNRPVLATPVGGLVEMVEPGRSGWLTETPTVDGLLELLEPLIAEPERARALTAAGGPRAALQRLSEPDRTRAAYAQLIDEGAPRAGRPRRGRAQPTVSVVVPYYRMDEFVEATIRSIAEQTVPASEVVVVNDGSFREQDALVQTLADRHRLRLIAQPNSGLSAARNLGIACSQGRYVLPLDPDNVLEPEFIERCLHAMEADDRLAYVTTWSSYIDERDRLLGPERGYAPFGNWSRLVERNNIAGDGTALLRRRWFDIGFAYHVDLTSYEDWFLYRELHRAGHHGAVVPRRLFRYRVRSDSMLRTVGLRNTGLIFDEMNALIVESETQWMPSRG
jgi:glycogen(starch) synthase